MLPRTGFAIILLIMKTAIRKTPGRFAVPVALAALFAGFALSGGTMPDVDEIRLAGDYSGHLQDVWRDGDALYWAHTTALIKTDLTGKIIAKADVNEHHAGLEVRDGKVYVAVCVLQSKTGGTPASPGLRQ